MSINNFLHLRNAEQFNKKLTTSSLSEVHASDHKESKGFEPIPLFIAERLSPGINVYDRLIHFDKVLCRVFCMVSHIVNVSYKDMKWI